MHAKLYFLKGDIMIIKMISVISGLILFSFYLSYYLYMKNFFKQLYLLPKKNNGNNPFVSIVIPTYNEAYTIYDKLNNVVNQEYSNIEIIVIDGGSNDDTVKIINNYVKNNNIKLKLIIQNQRFGKAYDLNIAFKKCCGDVIVMTDADSIWEKDALKNAILNFSDQKIGAITGRQVLLNPNQNIATRIEKNYRKYYDILRIGESMLDSTPIFNGPMTCFRRSLTEYISNDSMADDSELAIEIRKKGYKTIYDPDVVFYEYAPPSFKSRVLQKVRRGQGLVKLFLEEHRIMFNTHYGKFGTVIFPAEFFMHIFSPILLIIFLISLLFNLYITNYLMLLTLILLITFITWFFNKSVIVGLVLSFLDSQFILLISLIYNMFGKSQYKWKKVDEIRNFWVKDTFTE